MARRELFVWYRVRRERIGETRRVVAAMQRSLAAQWPGLQARLLVRDEGSLPTWMESYSRPAADDHGGAGIDVDVEAAIASAARSLAGLIEGERHVEAFDATT